MADNQSYNLQYIKRYLQQQLSPEEMHAFEKAMMADPFLADAIDGLNKADWQKAESHLSEIETNINKNEELKTAVPLFQSKTKWWRVAAIIAVLATGGILTYSVMKPSVNGEAADLQIAANKVALPHNSNDSIKAAEKTMSLQELKPENEYKQTPSIQPPLIAKNKVIPMESLREDNAKMEGNDVQQPAPEMEMARVQPPQNAIRDMVANEKNTAALAKTSSVTNTFRGKVITDDGEPVAGASVRIKDNNIATSTDVNGNFKLKSTDSTIKVDVNSVGYATANTSLNLNESAKQITLNKNNQTLSEVVVKSYNTKSGKMAVSSSVAQVAPGLSKDPEPSIGLAAYMQYIQKQSDSTLLADGRISTGEVVIVEFSVNSKGNPVHVRATGSNEKYFRKKATYFIENGPKWIPNGSENKTKISVSF